MLRAEFLKSLGLGLLAPWLGCNVDAPEMVRPNVLVILTDDQWFPSANRTDMPKAHAAIAAPGTTFSRAYVAVPRCGPSRAAMLLGRYPDNNNGIRSNDHASRRFRRLGRNLECFPRRLASEVGYRCGLAGKWLNDYAETPAMVVPGFRDWFATWPNWIDPVRANDNGTVKKTVTAQRDESYRIATRTIGFIQDAYARGVPFFSFASFNSPHTPATPSLANAGTKSSEVFPRPRPNFNPTAVDPGKPKEVREAPILGGPTVHDMRQKWRGMLEEVKDVDDAVGRICAAVNFDNTYVFFLTDNSTMWGEHRLAKKNQPYEEAVRTPLWVRGPSVMEGHTSTDLVVNIDVTTTIYELAGLDDRAGETDGRSLLPAMVGTQDYGARAAMRLDLPADAADEIEGWQAVRTNEALWVEHNTGESELYDMNPASPEYDPYQLRSRQHDRPEQTANLSAKLQELREASGQQLRDAEDTA